MADRIERQVRRECDNTERARHSGPVSRYEVIQRDTGEARQVDLCAVCSEPLRTLAGMGRAARTRKPEGHPSGAAGWPYMVYEGRREDAPQMM